MFLFGFNQVQDGVFAASSQWLAVCQCGWQWPSSSHLPSVGEEQMFISTFISDYRVPPIQCNQHVCMGGEGVVVHDLCTSVLLSLAEAEWEERSNKTSEGKR